MYIYISNNSFISLSRLIGKGHVQLNVAMLHYKKDPLNQQDTLDHEDTFQSVIFQSSLSAVLSSLSSHFFFLHFSKCRVAIIYAFVTQL